MISHTESLLILKTQIQEAFDFIVLNCYSVPNLKTVLKKTEKGEAGFFVSSPDHFKDTTEIDQLKEISKNYKKVLSRQLILSSFSYFESYIQNVISEVYNFHDREEMLALAYSKTKGALDSLSTVEISQKRKLQEYKKKNKELKYKKYIKLLEEGNYKFPTDLFSYYGIKKFFEDAKNMKSVDIPDLLRDGLHVDLTAKEIESFHNIRHQRNKVAHGDADVNLNLKKAIEYNKFLRELSIRVDKQIIEFYFVIEKI